MIDRRSRPPGRGSDRRSVPHRARAAQPSARGLRAPQSPGRVVPARRDPRGSHARGLEGVLPAAARPRAGHARRAARARREPAAPRPALPPAPGVPARRPGRAGVGRRRALQPRPPRREPVGAARSRCLARRFDELADLALSEPLDRSRALWRILVAPRARGRQPRTRHEGAPRDGRRQVRRRARAAAARRRARATRRRTIDDAWRPRPAPGATRLASTRSPTAAASRCAPPPAWPAWPRNPARGGRIADTLRRAALSVGEDMLRPAPSSYVNVPIGARRTLVTYAAPVQTRARRAREPGRDAQRRLPRRGRGRAAPGRARAPQRARAR